MKDINEQCTTLEQSKKLIDLGFTEDSASARIVHLLRNDWAVITDSFLYYDEEYPCWTIADMMKIINQVKRVYFDRNKSLDLCTFIIIENSVIIQSDNDEMQDTIDFVTNNLRESLFNCLVWLKEEKYL